jgi:CDP-glucose 4,6-dehydratase
VASSYRNSFFNIENIQKHKKAIATARAGNVIGGGDFSENRIVPDIVQSITANKKIVLRNPSSIRPWQHVIEPVVGYLMLGKSNYENPINFAQAWNFGPQLNDVLTVEDLTKLSIKHWGATEKLIEIIPEQFHEANMLRLDISKAQKYLFWKPKFGSKQAIEITIDWYKAVHRNLEDTIKVTQQQVEDYFEGL